MFLGKTLHGLGDQELIQTEKVDINVETGAKLVLWPKRWQHKYDPKL